MKTGDLNAASRPSICLTDGLVDMLGKTSPEGMVWFKVHSQWILQHNRLPKNTSGTEILIQHELFDQAFLLAPFQSDKKFHQSIEASHQLQSNGQYLVRFNLLRLLHIDPSLPDARCDAIAFAAACVEFFESHPDVNTDIQYTNPKNRDSLSGEITCRCWSEQQERMTEDQRYTDHIRSVVKRSEALRGHLAGMARVISRTAPTPWMSLSERQLFAPHKGPRHLRMLHRGHDHLTRLAA